MAWGRGADSLAAMRYFGILSAVCAFALALGAGSGVTCAQDSAPAAQLQLTFGGGFIGQSSASGGGSSFDQDNSPTFGGGLRFEGVFGRHFAAGLRFAAHSAKVTGGSALSLGRNPRMDAGLYAKVRFPLADGSAVYYLAAMGGYSRSFATDGSGFHVGAVGGVEALLTPHFGGLLELGWMRHQIGDVELRSADDDQALDVSTNQLFVMVGYFIPF